MESKITVYPREMRRCAECHIWTEDVVSLPTGYDNVRQEVLYNFFCVDCAMTIVKNAQRSLDDIDDLF